MFSLRLRGDGSLHVSSCIFTGDAITARHPLLGALQINRGGVTALERLDGKPEVKSDE